MRRATGRPTSRSRGGLIAVGAAAAVAAASIAGPATAGGPAPSSGPARGAANAQQALTSRGPVASVTAGTAPALATLPRPGLPALSPLPGAAELPGGGTRIFPGKNYVALYGHPGTPVLGVLGEQGTKATIRRAKRLAQRYQKHSKRQVIPALEIIATIASASAGRDGDYSAESSPAKLRPLVNAAGRRAVYVVLDLQPGRTNFLKQAKRYTSLLRKPHVGLALDPEWRLKPGQRHLRQIGSVDASEINRVSRWLARFTRERDLPQKMLLLHQFRTSMIRNRSSLNTSRPELALAIQMDGLGSQPAKRATWRALRANAPKRIKFGWKNFIDEDRPTLSPKRTMAIKPQPRWVSYQ